MSKWFTGGLLLAALVSVPSLAGCRTAITVERLQPARVRLGTAKRLVLVQAKGRPTVRQDVAEALYDEVKRGRYFGLEDRRREGGEVVPAGDAVRLRGVQGPAEGEIGVLVEVYEARLDEVMREERSHHDRRTATGTERVETVTQIPTWEAEMWVGVTLFDHTNRALLTEREYHGTATGDADRVSRAAVRRKVAAAAMKKLLNDITPRKVRERIFVDRSDGAQATTIQRAVRGDLEGAASAAKRYYDGNPRNAAAAFNLAVFTDALGDYDAALIYYDAAIELSPQSYYFQARDECLARQREARAMAKAEPPRRGRRVTGR